MKFSTVRHLGSALLLVVGIASYHAAPALGAEPTESASAEQKIPSTAEGIWQAIDQQTSKLNNVIQSGALTQVHHHAFAIRDLTAALPERSKSLSADKLTQVNANVKFVATLAERLDATGDGKDKAGTQANFEKLKKVLQEMRAHYPKAAQ